MMSPLAVFLILALVNVFIKSGMGLAAKCDPGWSEHHNKCYKVFYDPKVDAGAAEGVCASYGAFIAHVKNQEENDWIANYAANTLKGTPSENSAIILSGFREIESATAPWYWKTGADKCPAGYFNWAPGEPNGDGNNMVMYTQPGAIFGKWNDQSVASKYPVICEKGAIGAPSNAGSCNYVYEEDPCVTIKQSTLFALMASCGCDK